MDSWVMNVGEKMGALRGPGRMGRQGHSQGEGMALGKKEGC